MGYLDGTSVTVDAVLTKKGREILKNGQNLNIVSFTASDTGVDYTLWNPDHPSGSAYYGEAIENLPMLEASVHANLALRNRLVTLPQNTITIPTLELQLPGSATNTLTFNNENTSVASPVIANLKGYATTGNATPIYCIIDSPNVVNIQGRVVQEMSGIAKDYIDEAGIKKAIVIEIVASTNNQWSINCSPDTTQKVAGRKANITVIHPIGAYNTFDITNNVTELSRNMIGSQRTIG